jgi:hypothetical protein
MPTLMSEVDWLHWIVAMANQDHFTICALKGGISEC